jgi:hypothetical protein
MGSACWTARVSADLAKLLSPIVRPHEAGKLRFRRNRPVRRRRELWEIVEP